MSRHASSGASARSRVNASTHRPAAAVPAAPLPLPPPCLSSMPQCDAGGSSATGVPVYSKRSASLPPCTEVVAAAESAHGPSGAVGRAGRRSDVSMNSRTASKSAKVCTHEGRGEERGGEMRGEET